MRASPGSLSCLFFFLLNQWIISYKNLDMPASPGLSLIVLYCQQNDKIVNIDRHWILMQAKFFQAWRAGVCPRSGRSKSLPTGLAHHLLYSQCGSSHHLLQDPPFLTVYHHFILLVCSVLPFFYLSPGSSSLLPPWPLLPHQLQIFTSAAVKLDVSALSRPRLFATRLYLTWWCYDWFELLCKLISVDQLFWPREACCDPD